MDQPVQTSESDAQQTVETGDLYIVAGIDQVEAYANSPDQAALTELTPGQAIAEIAADSNVMDHYRNGALHA